MENYKRLKTDVKFKNRILQRTKIIQLIRRFFDLKNFIEVETPIIVQVPGMEPNLNPFKTEVIDVGNNVHSSYLITSPEYAMKKLLVGGFSQIYQITKCFRNNESWGGRHNPEFTMIEWYRTDSDYNIIIQDVIDLSKYIAIELFDSTSVLYQGQVIDFDKAEVCTVNQVMQKYANINLDDVWEIKAFKSRAIKKGYSITTDDSWDDIFFKIFLNEVEPKLGATTLTIIKDYPISMASLSKVKKSNPKYAERFEAYCFGLELCNGFSELTDAQEQLSRLKIEQALRKKLGKDNYDIDMSFIKALELGMLESGGVALGIDRLIMLFTDAANIEDVILFPMNDVIS